MTKQTQTDAEIRAEFDAAAARQALRSYPRVEIVETERLEFASAGATWQRRKAD